MPSTHDVHIYCCCRILAGHPLQKKAPAGVWLFSPQFSSRALRTTSSKIPPYIISREPIDVPSTAPDAQAPVTAIRLARAPSEQVPAEITKEIKCGEPASPDPKTSRSAVPPQQALTASMQATYARTRARQGYGYHDPGHHGTIASKWQKQRRSNASQPPTTSRPCDTTVRVQCIMRGPFETIKFCRCDQYPARG